MKKIWKQLISAGLCLSLLAPTAGAITKDGESETWFDAVWEIIMEYGLNSMDDPYIFQNYINQYLEAHPEEIYSIMNGLLSMLDTHSMYLSAETYSQGFATLQNYVGIGVALIQGDEGVQVAEVVPYSAAYDAGVQVGDVILAIDGEDVASYSITDVAELLRGEEGTDVTLMLRREARNVFVTCTRRVTNNVYVSSQTLEEGIEYIRIAAMGSDVDLQVFEEIWAGLSEKGTNSVVLDLRGNGGGLLNMAFRMADIMTAKEDVLLGGIRWREDMGGTEYTYSTNTGIGQSVENIVILVDDGTASAAELLAGSLKETGTATLVGTQTYGKGQGQYHFELVNGDVLVITTLAIELPKTGGYEGVGIEPDVVVENNTYFVNTGEFEPLDTTLTLRYGESSEAVYAMTQRLAILGYVNKESRVFNETVLNAVSEFCADTGLSPSLMATPQMLETLEQITDELNGLIYTIDVQLKTAVEMCREANNKE